MKYGLIGKNVSNSYSSFIHQAFANFSYTLKSLNKSEFIKFLEDRDYNGLNITTPYKLLAYSKVDVLDEVAKSTKSINTIVNKEGTLFGYNTDYDGFLYLLKSNNVDVFNKKVAVLGTGGAALTVQYALKELKAKEAILVSRKKNIGTISYQDLKNRSFDILINASPRGMTNKAYLPLVNLKYIQDLKVVIDLIYNPRKTILLQNAESLGIRAINGLDMLIEQARRAEELFQNTNIENLKNTEIKKQIVTNNLNIVLIGMPYAGKSSVGKKLSQTMKRDFLDLDELFEEEYELNTSDYIKIYGEKAFRKAEHNIVKKVSFLNGKVIATGGGVVLNKENIKLLRQNSFVVLLRRNVDDIVFDNYRPLTTNKRMYLVTEQKRKKMYLKAKDILIMNNDIEKTVKEIVRKYYEIVNN